MMMMMIFIPVRTRCYYLRFEIRKCDCELKDPKIRSSRYHHIHLDYFDRYAPEAFKAVIINKDQQTSLSN